VFLAMGSVGPEGNLQRVAVQAAAAAGVDQLVRLSVFNAGPDSLGINQRAHSTIDFTAETAGLRYTTIRPAIWSASIMAGAAEIRTAGTWTGLADEGRVALFDHRDTVDAAVHILTTRSTWGRHYDLTGPALFSWPEALDVLAELLGEKVTFVTTTERALIGRLTGAGIAPGMAELLVTREWAILAGENERITTTFAELTGRAPRSLDRFLAENLDSFR
jgi:uncharacterized protein YbjT (DUF2867 family)